MDGRRNNKGTIGNKGGRPSKADEQLANTRIARALRTIHSKDDDEDAIHEFLVDYGQSKDGKNFFAQHLLGLPQKNVDVTSGGEVVQQITGIEIV